MKIQIGAYVIEHATGFPSEAEAVKYVNGLYPELDRALVTKSVKKLINKDADKSGNTVNANPDGEKQHAETGSGITGKKQSGKG